MNRNMLRWFTPLMMIALWLLSSCSKEQIIETPNTDNLSAKVEYHGKVAPIKLSATLSENEMRAYSYDDNNTLENKEGALPKLKLESEVPVAVYVRKKGDEAKTVSAVRLLGKVTKEKGEYKIDIKGSLVLREPDHSLAQGKWEVLCSIGGHSNGELPGEDEAQLNNFNLMVYPTSIWSSVLNANDQGTVFATNPGDDIPSMMPWMTDWSDLETSAYLPNSNQIEEGGSGYNGKLHFKPKGILLKIALRSDLASDTQFSLFKINAETSSLVWGGHFDMTSPKTVGNTREPAFVKSTNIGKAITLTPIQAGDGSLQDPYVLKAGEEATKALYIWAMPADPYATKKEHRVSFELRAVGYEVNEKDLYLLKRKAEIIGTYIEEGITKHFVGKDQRSRNSGQDAFALINQTLKIQGYEHGRVYTFKPIISSDLFISEIVVRPNVHNSNLPNDPRMKDNERKSTWGGVEIYNPTATPIDLSQYALARVTIPDNQIISFWAVAHPTNLQGSAGQYATGEGSLENALAQPLTLREGEASTLINGTPRPQNTTHLRYIYGKSPMIDGKPYLMPGMTAVLLDASYARYESTTPEAINVDDVGSIGIQLKNAFEKGYTQFVVAIDNAEEKNKVQSWDDPKGAVLYAGFGDSYYLYKKNKAGQYKYLDMIGTAPTHEANKNQGMFLLADPKQLYIAKFGRDGNSRTRFTVINSPGNRSVETWGAAPSYEGATTGGNGDFVNTFMTFGSRRWLGPTEHSRQSEWDSIESFSYKTVKRKWTLAKQP